MAIEVKKINQTVSTTPTTPNTDVGSTAVNNKPIDLTSNSVKNDIASNDVINYINSDEFKALAPEEQLKQLKAKFFPSSSIAEVQKYLTAAKQSIAQSAAQDQDKQAVTAATPESLQAENESSTSSLKQTKIESSIEKLGIKGDIDDVKAQLLLREKNGNITKEESQVLAQLRAFEESLKNDGKKVAGEDVSAEVEKIKMVMSEEFRNKTNNEKLDVFIEYYLSKTDENFNNLSNKEKPKYIEEQRKDLLSIVSSDKKLFCKFENQKEVKDAALLLSAAEKSGISLEEYKNMPQEKLQQIIKQEGQEKLKQVLTLVPPEKLEGKSSKEKIDAYADYFLSVSDDEYNSLENAEDKAAYRKKKFNEFIEKDLHIKNWSNLSEDSQEKYLTYGLSVLKGLAEEGKSFEDYNNLPLDRKTQFLIKRLKLENNPKNAEIIKNTEEKLDLISEIQAAGIENPTEKDVYNHLQRLENQGKLTTEQKNLLKEYNVCKEIGLEIEHEHINVSSNNLRAKALGCEVKDYIQDSLKDLNKDNYKEYSKIAKEIARGAVVDKSIEDLHQMRNILKEKGLSQKQIDDLIPAKFYNRLQAKGLAHNDGKLVAKAIDSAMQSKDTRSKEITENTVEISAKYLKDDELVTVGETAIQHEPLVKPFAKSINNREYITKEAAANVSQKILSSDNVSNASKAVFTKDFVTEAAVNGAEEQVYFGKVLSTIDNPAVTEGLAAASNSVDSSVRAQYNSYVDSAAKNYSLEQQATIRSAQQSGEVSKPTLAQTTPAAVSSAENSGSQTSQVQSSQAPSKSSTVAKSTSSASTSGRTIVSSNPTSAPANSKRKVQSGRTGVGQNVEASYDTKVMQQKKEALLDKIVSYETSKNKSSENVSKTVQSDRRDSNVVQSEETKTEVVGIEEQDIKIAEDEQEILKAVIEDIFQKNSVSAAYAKLADTLGEAGKDRFLEIFASKGREMDVRSFAQNYRGNSDTILKLFDYCQSESLRFDLLKLLPSNSIAELVSTQKISSTDFERLIRENKVESNVILDYINKNKGSMSVQEMKKYLSFLSLADRNALFEILKNTKGSDEWLQAQQDNMRTVATDTPDFTSNSEGLSGDTIPTLDDGISIGSNKVSMRGQYNKMKKRGPFFLNA